MLKPIAQFKGKFFTVNLNKTEDRASFISVSLYVKDTENSSHILKTASFAGVISAYHLDELIKELQRARNFLQHKAIKDKWGWKLRQPQPTLEVGPEPALTVDRLEAAMAAQDYDYDGPEPPF